MPHNESRMTALRLLQMHRSTHTLEHWQGHWYAHTIIMNSVRYCLCADCFEEMSELTDQYYRDLDSAVEELRESARRFLGFDVWEEWQRKVK